MKSFIYYKKFFFVRGETKKSLLKVVFFSTQSSTYGISALKSPIRAVLAIILLTLVVVQSNGQSCITWQTILGEPNLDERATDIWFDETTETIWAAGYQTAINNSAIKNKNGWLMQFNNAGELINDFVIQDTANLFINRLAKTETGFVLAGNRQPLDSLTKQTAWLALFKGDSIQWSINSSLQSEVKDVLVTPSQKIVVTGYLQEKEERRKDLFIEQYDTTGNLIWQQSYGGTKDDEATAIIYHQDYLLIAGSTASSDGDVSFPLGGKDVWLLAINPDNGALIRQKNFGGTSNDVATGLAVLPNGEITVLAESLSSNGDISNSIGSGDLWLAKMDKQWNIVWEKSYGGLDADYPNAITSFPNGDLLITGTSFSEDGDIKINYGYLDSWLSRINYTDGSIIWSKVIGGNDLDQISALHIYDEQKIIAAGNTDSFDIQCKKENKKHSNQNVWLLGLDEVLLPSYDFFNELTPAISYTIQKPSINLQNHGLDEVEILITDIAGKTYYKAPLKGRDQQSINFSTWQKGIYSLTYEHNRQIHFVKKMGLF